MAAPAPAASARSRLNLTEWNTPRELLRIVVLLSLPVAATNALQTLISFVDTRMVSELAKYPLAALPALGVGRSGMFLTASLFMGLGVGITAYVSRLTGAGEHEKARQYATVGVVTGLVLGVLISIIGLLWGEGPVKMMVSSQGGDVSWQLAERTRTYAWDFMGIMFWSMAAVGMQFSAVSVFNSLGRTMFPLWLLIIGNVANLIGNILLIPVLEVQGSALSTLATTVISCIVATIWLQRQKAIRISLRATMDSERMRAGFLRGWEMVKLGLPVTVQVMARSLSMLTLIKLITYLPNSVVGQGALQVGLQVESLAFMPAFAFSTAAATLVGQNLGARKPEQARQSTIFCLWGSQIVMVVMGLGQMIWPEFFIHLFIGHGPDVDLIVEPASNYIRILGACLPGLGLGLTMMGALRGSGDTAITAWMSLASMYIVRIPLAIFLSMENIGGTGIGLGWGLNGLWWAMTTSVYVEALLAWLRFRSGKWAQIRLSPEHAEQIESRLASDSDAELERDVEVLEAEFPTQVVVPTEPLQTLATSQQPQATVKCGDEHRET
jgi:putative MATE family efflux protein